MLENSEENPRDAYCTYRASICLLDPIRTLDWIGFKVKGGHRLGKQPLGKGKKEGNARAGWLKVNSLVNHGGIYR